MPKRWYIVHAYSNFENKVADSIREQAKQRGLAELFDEIMVPKEKVTEVRRGRKIDAERKFFPGYVLVKMDLTDEAYHLIKNTPKVTGFLGTDKKPMPISEAEAQRILQQVQEGVDRPKPSITFRGRRAGTRFGRSIRVVQRHRGRGRRRPLARQGRGVDLRPRDAGRTGIRTGREDISPPSWPGLSRPSTPCLVAKTWMPGTRPGMTNERPKSWKVRAAANRQDPHHGLTRPGMATELGVETWQRKSPDI